MGSLMGRGGGGEGPRCVSAGILMLTRKRATKVGLEIKPTVRSGDWGKLLSGREGNDGCARITTYYGPTREARALKLWIQDGAVELWAGDRKTVTRDQKKKAGGEPQRGQSSK